MSGSGIIGKIPELAQYYIKESQWRDGLVVRSPNWLGDAVMTVPAMLQLKQLLPEDCGFFVVCPPGLKDFFESMEIVDITISLRAAHRPWPKGDRHRLAALKAGIGLLFNNSLRDAIYFKMAGVPAIFGSSMRGRGLLMKKKWTISMPRKKELNKIHHAARYLSMSNALGAPPWNGQMPVFKVKKEIELIQHEIIEAAEAGKLLLVAPGAAYGPSKMWPSEYFRKICSFWIENGGSVAVSGTHREKETADSVSDGLPRDKTFNLCGKTDLNELIMIIQNAVFCVANDSGIMHLAAVLGTPGIAIFGSTDPTSTSPVSENWQVLYEKMPCSPCFKRDCPRTRDKYECLHRIKPESVMGSLPI